MIKRLLVADRGEIARRIFATCRAIGIDTVAVYSDADADSPHVREADYAVHLPGNAPSTTYLRGDLLIAAARKAGADAVHPGSGFLADRADFAQAVIDAGLVWVGPPPAAMRALGDKAAARKELEVLARASDQAAGKSATDAKGSGAEQQSLQASIAKAPPLTCSPDCAAEVAALLKTL